MSLNKKLDKLIKNRPQYTISKESADNQSAAKKAASTRDLATVNAEQQIAQNAANANAAATGSSASGAGVLAAMSGVNAGTAASGSRVAAQEAQSNAVKRSAVMQSNASMVDEKDKAWDYNVNQPYQNKVAALRERKRARQELLMKGIDSAVSISATSLSMGGMSGSPSGGGKEVAQMDTKATQLNTPAATKPNIPTKVKPI